MSSHSLCDQLKDPHALLTACQPVANSPENRFKKNSFYEASMLKWSLEFAGFSLVACWPDG